MAAQPNAEILARLDQLESDTVDLPADVQILFARIQKIEDQQDEFMKLMNTNMECIKGLIQAMPQPRSLEERNPAYSLFLKYEESRKEALAAGAEPDYERFLHPAQEVNIWNTSADDVPIAVIGPDGKPVQTDNPQYVCHKNPPPNMLKDVFVMAKRGEPQGTRLSREFIEGLIKGFEEITADARFQPSKRKSLFDVKDPALERTTKPIAMI